MTFRVTPHRNYELTQMNAQSRYAQSSVLSMQVSSGIRVHKPSDDPIAQKTILNQSSLISRFDAQLSVVSTTRTTLSEANNRVLDAQQLIVQAKEIALQARGEEDETAKGVFVNQLNGILNQLEGIANARFNGEYLFSGTELSTPPFSGIIQGNPVYQGGTFANTVNISGGLVVTVNDSGQSIFRHPTGGGVVVYGDTGITGGAGTSTENQWTTLTVKHTQTLYSGASGVQPGTDSVNGDTILGSAGTHQLTIVDTSGDGSAGTISLNGGEAVAFTSADTNLQVIGPDGEVVYLNTQSIAPGFNGAVDITANGTLSIDGGLTEVPIDFSANQMVTSAASSGVQNFNTTGVVKVGTVGVEPAATSDVFQAVIALRDTILNKNGLTGIELDNAFNMRLRDLDSANNHLLNVIGDQAVALQSLDRTETRLTTLKLNAQTILTDAQGTDYFQAVSQLQEQQTLLQFTLQSLTALNSFSLVDFLN